MFSVNNRTNMFVYQDTSGPNNNDNVFYLKLSELFTPHTSLHSKRGSNPSQPSGSLSGSSSCATITGYYAATNIAGATITSNISGTIISNVQSGVTKYPSKPTTSADPNSHLVTSNVSASSAIIVSPAGAINGISAVPANAPLNNNAQNSTMVSTVIANSTAAADLIASAPQSFSSAVGSVTSVAWSDIARYDREEVSEVTQRKTFRDEDNPSMFTSTSEHISTTSNSVASVTEAPVTVHPAATLPSSVVAASSAFHGVDGRPRISSVGERDVITEGVTASHSSSKGYDYIELTVHGIAQPGPNITEELVSMLQKRLDEAVLDAVCVLLWNNPQYKLPPEDVHFIQPPKQPPQLTL
ncbi:uncharacterized protein LOC108680982, partial [Hyalella azteca]|uniref:Uncharacterized protein LOC108680982 n=1 Tax=Hyalella azteca TaxID=294128 RepID=A0A8B7PGY3_HYAAZ